MALLFLESHTGSRHWRLRGDKLWDLRCQHIHKKPLSWAEEGEEAWAQLPNSRHHENRQKTTLVRNVTLYFETSVTVSLCIYTSFVKLCSHIKYLCRIIFSLNMTVNMFTGCRIEMMCRIKTAEILHVRLSWTGLFQHHDRLSDDGSVWGVSSVTKLQLPKQNET